MRAPLSWLREFAPIDGAPADLAAALSSLGLVVEGVESVGGGLGDIVVGLVLATRPHPGADRVQLVDVDDGGREARQVVCGAFNFGAGDLVALAPIGARLPGGLEISRRKVRGQWSEGMLCSAAELGLSDDADGILLLGDGIVPGTALTDALGVSPDVVFDLDITPNRPDALCVAGVARDLAAHLRVPFAFPVRTDGVPAPSAPVITDLSVEVLADDLCPLFTATALTGATVGPSPAWLARRLVLAGMRPINNLVDISNYVMLELGQPNHPYDLDRLPGQGLLVRRGNPGETVVTLDDVERVVGPDDCLICDAKGTPVGIGGVMGGASSEIASGTTRVLLEAAWFLPGAVARTGKRLGLRSEAAIRFERGVDPDGVDRSVARYVELAASAAGAALAGASPGVVVAARPGPFQRPPVRLRTGRVNAVLGTSLAPGEVCDLLAPLGFAAAPVNGSAGDFEVTLPSWRPDCDREIDLVEEVARHHGYAAIARTLPAISQVGRLTAYQRDRRRVRRLLAGYGLAEAWATSFYSVEDLVRCGLSADAVEIENPLAADESVLRTSLLPGLLRALVTNAGHRQGDVGLFEIGHVFERPPAGASLPSEPERLAAALGGSDAAGAVRLWRALAEELALESWSFRVEAVPGLHPGRSAVLQHGESRVGVVGEIDPEVLAAHGLEGRVAWLELDLGRLLAGPRRSRVFRPVSRFPSAEIDLAFEVDDAVPAGEVEATLAAAAGELLERLELFDVFRGAQVGERRRSLAWRLRLSALDHTLGEDELAAVRLRCIAAVEGHHPARLRG